MSDDVDAVVSTAASTSKKAFTREVTYRDCVLIVLGPPGAGKTTFVHQLTGTPICPPVNELNIDTTEIDYRCIQPNKWTKGNRLFVIDTPPIDGPYNYDLFFGLVGWIRAAIQRRVAFIGCIFVHDLMIDKATFKNNTLHQIFAPCVQKGVQHKLLLATTKWSRIPDDEAERKQKSLEKRDWKPFLDDGAQVVKLIEIGKFERNAVMDMLPEPVPTYGRYTKLIYDTKGLLLRLVPWSDSYSLEPVKDD